ncbi:type II toxin-antitoxin system HipA family toxin [Thiomicrospira sp. WB1]|uniref:type II toxin-antitoxin system HipA family toxin n=1 Tax=Thiomicrospira sp. WB1 TaxID=1685380 RepID=UPI000AFF80B3|nr:type II toxin-antitoxin system HipA family toxin [Thiomicrospira sp. WB1]
MNGLLVGTLSKLKNGALRFVYAEEWLNSQFARSLSLSLPLARRPYEGDVVYNFLDNLLPDNEAIRAKMQVRFHTSTTQPFDLLAAVGQDCVGAIQLSSEFEPGLAELKAKPLNERQVAELLKGYASSPLGMQEAEADFRISIAGAQEKTALLKMDGNWYLPQGSTPTTHILKLPIGVLAHHNLDLSQSCENEWLCMQIAKGFGLPVAQTEVLTFEDQKVLSVERFDRKWLDGKRCIRLPQEDMCQALGVAPALKYESDGGPGIKSIMQVLRGSKNAQADRAIFFKAQILFWLLAAPDGHGKNFSLFIEPNNGYRLTPLYDVLSAYPLIGGAGLQKQKIKMAMGLYGKQRHFKWDGMMPRHFVTTAKAVGYSETLAVEHLEEMLGKAHKVVESVQRTLPEGFPNQIAQPIFDGLIKKTEVGMRYLESIASK